MVEENATATRLVGHVVIRSQKEATVSCVLMDMIYNCYMMVSEDAVARIEKEKSIILLKKKEYSPEGGCNNL